MVAPDEAEAETSEDRHGVAAEPASQNVGHAVERGLDQELADDLHNQLHQQLDQELEQNVHAGILHPS